MWVRVRVVGARVGDCVGARVGARSPMCVIMCVYRGMDMSKRYESEGGETGRTTSGGRTGFH